MRLYQIIMSVPDDFVPEQMELKASFNGEIDICSEGFIGSDRYVVCQEEACETADNVDIVDDVNVKIESDHSIDSESSKELAESEAEEIEEN